MTGRSLGVGPADMEQAGVGPADMEQAGVGPAPSPVQHQISPCVLQCPKITAAFGESLAWQRDRPKVSCANQESGVPRPWPFRSYSWFFMPLAPLWRSRSFLMPPCPVLLGRRSAAIGLFSICPKGLNGNCHKVDRCPRGARRRWGNPSPPCSSLSRSPPRPASQVSGWPPPTMQRRRQLGLPSSCPNASRIFAPSSFMVNGFWMKLTSSASRPWWVITSAVYPDMKRCLIWGNRD